MTFLLYKPTYDGVATRFAPTGQTFKMAGNHLIKKAWIRYGRPIDKGWSVSADELIRILTDDAETYQTLRLFVDFHPGSRRRIGIVEILDIHAYTFGQTGTEPRWTPFMLRMRDIFYEEDYEPELTDATKATILSSLDDPSDFNESIEFLYMTKDWGWGRNGMTNAAFIDGKARDYFRQFF